MSTASDGAAVRATKRYSRIKFFIVLCCGGSLSGSTEVFGADNGESRDKDEGEEKEGVRDISITLFSRPM